MTIAISINVNDGIVLASDSASSLVVSNDQGNTSVQNIYNNADKIYNLYKGLPIGAMTWGSGSVGTASIATLAKDFRRVLMQDAGFDKEGYTIEDVAQRFKQFIYDERYVPEYQAWTSKPSTGFLVAGYSAGSQLAETWKIVIDENGECHGPLNINFNITWDGQPNAIQRLILGFDYGLAQILHNHGIDENSIDQIINSCLEQIQVQVAVNPMPIQDAIDLARFLVETTINFSRFTPGAPTVGGPVEIAAITKHENFKWVQRKHYFNTQLNP